MVTSKTPQERNPDGSPKSRHPAWKPHPIQGWSPDFIPKLTADALDMKSCESRHHHTGGPQAMQSSRQLAQKEGIFVGTSAGATFAAALEISKGRPERHHDSCDAARHRRAVFEARRCSRTSCRR